MPPSATSSGRNGRYRSCVILAAALAAARSRRARARRQPRRRGRRGVVPLARGRGHGRPRRATSGHRRGPRRLGLRGRQRRRVPALLRAVLGPLQGQDDGPPGKPRVRHAGRGRLLPLLRPRRGRPDARVLRLPARRLAGGRAQHELRRRRRVRRGLAAGALAARRARLVGGDVHGRVRPPPALQLRVPRPRQVGPAALAGAAGRRVPSCISPGTTTTTSGSRPRGDCGSSSSARADGASIRCSGALAGARHAGPAASASSRCGCSTARTRGASSRAAGARCPGRGLGPLHVTRCGRGGVGTTCRSRTPSPTPPRRTSTTSTATWST